MTDFRELWSAALPFETFVAESTEHKGLWEGIHRLARVPAWALEAAPDSGEIHLLVIAEDWCGDASNTVPVVAKWAETVPGIDLKIIRRDEHPAVMDRYLTNGSRSVPIVIALDGDFRELGHWGPRPASLQDWVMVNRQTVPKDELYPQIRRWYARDGGESTLREVAATAGLAVPTGSTG